MRYKKHMLLLALAIFLFGIAGAWASDTNDTVTGNMDDSAVGLSDDDIMGIDENEDVLNANEKTFGDLNSKINGNSDRDIYLDSDYKYSDRDSDFMYGISIDRDLNVYGNGHTINGSTEARIFEIKNGNVAFYNITFTYGNAHYNDGGAINGRCTVVNCTFIGNNADWGGALKYGFAINCTFTHNNARYAGAIGWGSAVNCTFIGNHAIGDGGAMTYGSAVNCTFTDNDAEIGGAMADGSAVNCTFIDNKASNYGGALDVISAVNCTFIDNKASNYGHAMHYCYYLECIGQKEDYYGSNNLNLYFDVSNFTSTYKSNDEFRIALRGQLGGVDFINTDVVIYKEGVEVRRYSRLSSESVIFDLAVGIYTAEVKITYPKLDPVPKNITLTINKATPKIEVAVNESIYPDDVIVNVKSDVGGTYVVKVGGKTQIVTLEANVAKNISFAGLAANETGYVVNVTCDETENYTSGINDVVIIKVKKATPKIEVAVNESIYPDDVIVNVKSDVGGTYVVKVGGKTQIVTLEANVAKNISFAGLAANETGYVVNVTCDETENYTSGINDVVIIKVKKATPTITATEIIATYNINGDLVITLTDSTGNPMASEEITVDLNGIKTYITDMSGQIKITTKGLIPKTYSVAITFEGNTNYTKTNKDVKVIVKKATPKIVAKKKTFKTSVKTKKYTITLKDNTGKAIKKAKVTLKVKGKTYKATTNSKGKATFKIKNLNKKGTFKATVTYKGDKYYNKVTKKAKIKVIITFKTVSKGSKDKSAVKEIQQALKDNGYYLSYKGHYLMVDGKFESCTERSVRQFQKDKNLKVTGKVDEKTAHELGMV